MDPAGYDLLTPVPLHKVRQRARGYNQSERLAREALSAFPGARLDVSLGEESTYVTGRVEAIRLDLDAVELEITQIGKECHSRCAIYDQAGDCVMPKEGVFARVVKGGKVQAGDRIEAPVAID